MSEIEMGNYIKIVFDGMVKTGSGKNAKLFDVFVKKEAEETDAEDKEETPEEKPEGE